MSAIAAGSVVIASLRVTPSVFDAAPKVGVCQSVGGVGPPPTAVLIDWEDGTQTTFAVTVGTTASPVLFSVNVPLNPSLLGTTVDPSSPFPNPGGRFRGVVVMHFEAQDPSGSTLGDVVVVRCPEGFYTLPYANAVVIPSA